MTTKDDVEFLRNRIQATGIIRREDGELLLSHKGATLSWLIDLRPLFLQKDFLLALAAVFWERHKHLGRIQLAALETAAIPLLAALVMNAPLELGEINGVIVRKDRKPRGRGNTIEGTPNELPVILIDDVINSATSLEKARVLLEDAGKVVRDVFVVVDFHSLKGTDWRHEHAIKVESLFVPKDFGITLRSEKDRPKQRYKRLWVRKIPGAFPYHIVPKSAPVLVGSMIFRGSDSGTMYAFDAETGSTIWKYQTLSSFSKKGIWSTPAYFEGNIFFGAYNGVAYCLDAETGKERWTLSEGEWIGASPLVIEKHRLLCIGFEYERPWAKGSIAALDIDTGKKRWEIRSKLYQHGSAAYWQAGDMVIWGSADHKTLGIDAATGAIRWEFPTERSVKYAPCVDEARGIVAFASYDKNIYVLDASSGILLGKWQTGEICYTTPLIVKDRLYCGSGDRHMYVIDLERMELVKKIDMRARVYSSPRELHNRIIFGTNGGAIYEIDSDNLEVKGKLQLPDAVTNAVAVSDDESRIYISTYMNYLYAFERIDRKV